MNRRVQLIVVVALVFVSMLPSVLTVLGADSAVGLKWDSRKKERKVEAGASEATFQFRVTNETGRMVTVKKIRTSCGCTVAKAPRMPWKLAPMEGGDIDVAVDLRGKMGRITKSIFVDTSIGMETLTVQVSMPRMASAGTGLSRRQRNQLRALRNPQAIFKNDCAQCHVKPARGEHGKTLYQAACAICHEAHNRASMVPDLRKLEHPTSRQYWRQWITHGKKGTMMPGFARSEGGPLTEKQVDSLVAYLQQAITESSPVEGERGSGHAVSKDKLEDGLDSGQDHSAEIFLPIPELFGDEE